MYALHGPNDATAIHDEFTSRRANYVKNEYNIM